MKQESSHLPGIVLCVAFGWLLGWAASELDPTTDKPKEPKPLILETYFRADMCQCSVASSVETNCMIVPTVKDNYQVIKMIAVDMNGDPIKGDFQYLISCMGKQ